MDGRGAMRTLRVSAMVFALVGGACGLLGYTKVFQDTGATGGYLWFFFVSVLVVLGGGVAVLSRPRDGATGERICHGCGREAQADWALCPMCGTTLTSSGDRVPSRRGRGPQIEEGHVVEASEPTLGTYLFWIGIGVLDFLCVLFVLWLFVPSLGISHRLFSSAGGIPAIVMLDIGAGSILAGYSLAPWSCRL
jgi:hypothetical protein